jgi:type 1 fimbria pilin
MASGRTLKVQSAITALGLLLNGLGAAPAAANDISTLPCTAGDVEVVGPGTVVNEPCSCTPGGTFAAVVEFRIRNNTSSGRYCVTLHLVSRRHGVHSAVRRRTA